MSALKFSRSPYLDTHLSECIHAWTMGICEVGFHSMLSDPRVHARGCGYGSKFSTCSKCGMSVLKFF